MEFCVTHVKSCARGCGGQRIKVDCSNCDKKDAALRVAVEELSKAKPRLVAYSLAMTNAVKLMNARKGADARTILERALKG